jgi:hypothetical protein
LGKFGNCAAARCARALCWRPLRGVSLLWQLGQIWHFSDWQVGEFVALCPAVCSDRLRGKD